MAATSCTQCGACLDACPVFRLRNAEECSPKAKHELLAAGWKDDGVLHWQRMLDLAGLCAGCERCATACPRHLSVPERLAEARARHPRWPQYFWKEWIQRGNLLWKLTARTAPLIPSHALPRRLGLLHASALAMREPAPRPGWLRLAPETPQMAAGAMAIFGGCTATRLRPLWLRKTRHILQRLGGHVLDASFDCCASTYEHAGMLTAAVSAARHNRDCWLRLGKPRLVTVCASCLHGLRHYAEMDGLFSGTQADEWLACLTPLSTLLREAHVEPTGAAPSAFAYHSPCHWCGQDADLAWLRAALPGLRQGTALCCGFGGVLQMLNPELGRELASACWHGLEQGREQTPSPSTNPAPSPTPPVLTGCSGCVMHLTASAPSNASIVHWLDIWEDE